MNTYRNNTRVAGILIITGMLAGVLSVVPVIDSADYLMKAAGKSNQVLMGAIFHFIMSIAYIGMAISLYPILKEHNKSLALGFLSFRIIATVFLIMGVLSLVLLLFVSREYVKAPTSDLAYLKTIGDLLRSGRDLSNHVAMIISLNIGGIMFYVLLFQTRLIPKWLSAWGFIGATLAIAASLLVMFSVVEIITPFYIALNVPVALQELILALWLIVKGFEMDEKLAT
ncbi:MAG: DUF4386 domain-containing protein [Bacteroidales bacterium]|nr:DUF4386 domain-containing protein [Bacteroidales bacterium]